jgi:hypothetical protein
MQDVIYSPVSGRSQSVTSFTSATRVYRNTALIHPRLLALTALILCFLCWSSTAVAQQDDDLNVYMMEATVKLQGKNSLGTGFMLMRPFQVQSGPQGSISGKVVLITAAHVLEEIPEDEITVVMHSLSPSGDWARHESKLPIRRNGQPLWRKNPEADVAVMYVATDIAPFRKAPTTDLLANDDLLEKNAMTPGINLKCLGFPLGMESNAAGFPILRTGDIASYPLLPTAKTKTFMMDFRVFKGNSGGPVYFSQPQFRGGVSFGGRAQFIVGLISQEALFPIQNADPYGSSVRELQLMVGIVVHASIIRQTVELLPLPETPQSEGVTIRMHPSH